MTDLYQLNRRIVRKPHHVPHLVSWTDMRVHRRGHLPASISPVSAFLKLPVVGAVVLRVGPDRVLHDDGIAGAEVVEEPLRIRRADVDAAVADVTLALIGHRPRRAVYE